MGPWDWLFPTFSGSLPRPSQDDRLSLTTTTATTLSLLASDSGMCTSAQVRSAPSFQSCIKPVTSVSMLSPNSISLHLHATTCSHLCVLLVLLTCTLIASTPLDTQRGFLLIWALNHVLSLIKTLQWLPLAQKKIQAPSAALPVFPTSSLRFLLAFFVVLWFPELFSFTRSMYAAHSA